MALCHAETCAQHMQGSCIKAVQGYSCLQALTVVAAGNIDLQPGTSGRACMCWGHRPRSLVCTAGQKLVRCSLGALRGPADLRLVHTLRDGEQFTQLAQACQVLVCRRAKSCPP